MRVFVDIGSHVGQTLNVALQSRWGFDIVHAIEPMPREFLALEHKYFNEPRIKLHQFALSNRNGFTTMYGTNDLLEASVFPEKNDVDAEARTPVVCVDASAFFSQLRGQIIVNLNAEGAEVLILDNLIHSGMIHEIDALLVDFDIRKVPGRQQNEERLRTKLVDVGFERWTAEYPDLPTHEEQITAWLEVVLGA